MVKGLPSFELANQNTRTVRTGIGPLPQKPCTLEGPDEGLAQETSAFESLYGGQYLS